MILLYINSQNDLRHPMIATVSSVRLPVGYNSFPINPKLRNTDKVRSLDQSQQSVFGFIYISYYQRQQWRPALKSIILSARGRCKSRVTVLNPRRSQMQFGPNPIEGAVSRPSPPSDDVVLWRAKLREPIYPLCVDKTLIMCRLFTEMWELSLRLHLTGLICHRWWG